VRVGEQAARDVVVLVDLHSHLVNTRRTP
jgi:hypothetical protein